MPPRHTRFDRGLRRLGDGGKLLIDRNNPREDCNDLGSCRVKRYIARSRVSFDTHRYKIPQILQELSLSLDHDISGIFWIAFLNACQASNSTDSNSFTDMPVQGPFHGYRVVQHDTVMVLRRLFKMVDAVL